MSFNGSLAKIDDSEPISHDNTLKSIPQSQHTKSFRDRFIMENQLRAPEYKASGEDLAPIGSAASRERNPLLYEEHDGSLTHSGGNQFAQAK